MKPSNKLIELAKTCISLENEVAVLEPKIKAIQEQVFAKYNFIDKYTNEKITNCEDVYCSDDTESIDKFYVDLHTAYINAGYVLPEIGYCPLLIAENQLRKAKNDFIKESETLWVGIDEFIDTELLYGDLAAYKKYYDININYVKQFIR